MRNVLEREDNMQDREVTSVLERKPVRSETQPERFRAEQQEPVFTVANPGYEEDRMVRRDSRTSIVLEKHCSVSELSKQWGFSENTIRRLFRKEPGVIKIVHQETLHKRGYTSMRIPERIAQRVHRRLQGLV